MKKSKHISERTSALIAGTSLLLMAVIAAVTYGYLHATLVVPNEAKATFQNLQSFEGLFKAELLGWTLILLLDGLVAWSLYHFFLKTNKAISFASAFLRVVYTVFLGVAIYELPAILDLVHQHLAVAGMGEQLQNVMDAINSFENIWSRGLIIFGAHLLVLGWLAFKTLHVPRLWGVLLILAGISYMGVHIAHATTTSREHIFQTIEAVLAVPMTLGEVGFAIWLVVKGGRKPAGFETEAE